MVEIDKLSAPLRDIHALKLWVYVFFCVLKIFLKKFKFFVTLN
jgi:hypothetical protein